MTLNTCFNKLTVRFLGKVFFVLASIIFSFFLTTGDLYAQDLDVAGISIRPGVIEEVVEPGDVLERTLRVTNTSSVSQTYYLHTKNITGISDQGTPSFSDGEGEVTGFELRDWVELPTESLEFAPGESREVNFTISVPENASPGGHFGGVFVNQRPPELRETGTAIGYDVGMILSLRVDGETDEGARLREFSSDKEIYTTPEVEMKILIENFGNTLVRPVGFIEITNMTGRITDTLNVNHPRPGGVFPGSERSFRVKWQGDNLSFGRYKASLNITYGEFGRRTITDEITFWILPRNTVLPVGAGIIITLLGLIIGVKLYVRRQIRLAQPAFPSVPQTPYAVYGHRPPVSKVAVMTLAVILFIVLFSATFFMLFA